MDFISHGELLELHQISISELAELLVTKEVSAAECVAYFGKRIEQINPALNSFVSLDLDAAMEKARAVDGLRANNRRVGVLGGIPFGVCEWPENFLFQYCTKSGRIEVVERR